MGRWVGGFGFGLWVWWAVLVGGWVGWGLTRWSGRIRSRAVSTAVSSSWRPLWFGVGGWLGGCFHLISIRFTFHPIQSSFIPLYLKDDVAAGFRAPCHGCHAASWRCRRNQEGLGGKEAEGEAEGEEEEEEERLMDIWPDWLIGGRWQGLHFLQSWKERERGRRACVCRYVREVWVSGVGGCGMGGGREQEDRGMHNGHATSRKAQRVSYLPLLCSTTHFTCQKQL